MVTIKDKHDIEMLRASGRLLAQMFADIEKDVVEGASTYDIDKIFEDMMKKNHVIGPCKGYYDYPAVTCISINDTVIHGIPSKKKILKAGDLVSIDVVINKDGYFTDSTHTYEIGKVSEDVHRLNVVTKKCLDLGIEAAGKKSARIQDIGRAVQSYAEKNGYSVVKDFCGHGVGFAMHEAPDIMNYVSPLRPNPRLHPGMVIAIEPMINMGKEKIRIDENGWDVYTADGKVACHWEHTVAITEDGAEILTVL